VVRQLHAVSVDDAPVDTVRLGLLSTARIDDAILGGAAGTDRVSVVAVASRDERRAREYAREHKIDRAHGSYEALLEDADVEAVYISLPNSLHIEWSLRALAAGKHVLCEKPLGRRPERVEEAFDAAENAGRVLMEAFMYRHHPQTRRLQDIVAAGEIGELRFVLASFIAPISDPKNVRMHPELDGGALMDLGCYCVNAARMLAGEPEVVFGQQVTGQTGVDVRFAGLLRFPGDVLAEIDCAFEMPYGSGLEAIGSAGSAFVQAPVTCRDPAVVLRRDGLTERIEIEDVDRYMLQLENFAAAVRGEGEPLLGREEAIGQARVLEALYRSAESGEAVRPELTAAWSSRPPR
jgi:D-xylose 1-dehydrogenase (NADP+, D-xylono-1,5-lactone-forming)